MAIPSTPQQYFVQTQNQEILVSWALSAGATSYIVNRSLDNVTYTTVATISGVPLATSYLDTTGLLGVQYFYQVAAANSSGTSGFTAPQSATPAPTGEMTLGSIRLAAQQRADRVNSQFVTTPEWNSYINQGMYELYDLLVTLYEDLYTAQPIQFQADGQKQLFDLPNGSLQFQNGLNTNLTVTAPGIYKLLGVDLALQSATNAYVTVNKFNFIDRNRFVYPNTASAIYGVFNMRYRLMGNQIEFIPTPTSGQSIRLWYVPRLSALLKDTDITTLGTSGWIDYVITKAAYYALVKEESDVSALVMQLQQLTERITTSASNRDAGQADTISDTRSGNGYGGGYGGMGFNGGSGGF